MPVQKCLSTSSKTNSYENPYSSLEIFYLFHVSLLGRLLHAKRAPRSFDESNPQQPRENKLPTPCLRQRRDMNRIPPTVRSTLESLPRMKLCARRLEGGCGGCITWEHSLIYAGRQVQETWSIIGLCVFHHLGPGLEKEKNVAIALIQATPEDLAKYPRADWPDRRSRLIKKYKTFLPLWGFRFT